MNELRAEGPNAQQIEYWNAVSGPRWVSFEELLDDQLSPLGLAAMDLAGLEPGEIVLDVGCGCGQTSRQLAERVGSVGRVIGLDLSGPMLARARARVAEAGLANVRFEQADAQTCDFEAGSCDLVFSRFGVMFFADPRAAFGNLRKTLVPGGRTAFVCWQQLQRNQWMLVPLSAVSQHVELPAPPGPGAPGPFSFADVERVSGILERAGFSEVEILPLEGELSFGGGQTLDRTVEFALNLGPAGAALREADAKTRARAGESVREALAPYQTPDGVRMGYAAWTVAARTS